MFDCIFDATSTMPTSAQLDLQRYQEQAASLDPGFTAFEPEALPSSWPNTEKKRRQWKQMRYNETFVSRVQAEAGFDDDNLVCHYCAVPVRVYTWQQLVGKRPPENTATADRRVALGNGAENAWRNLCVACYSCNQKKGTQGKTVFELSPARQAAVSRLPDAPQPRLSRYYVGQQVRLRGTCKWHKRNAKTKNRREFAAEIIELDEESDAVSENVTVAERRHSNCGFSKRCSTLRTKKNSFLARPDAGTGCVGWQFISAPKPSSRWTAASEPE